MSNYASKIDSGQASFTYTGHVKSYPQTPTDESQEIVEYRNQNGDILASFSSLSYNNSTKWETISDIRIAPQLTRKVRIRLISKRNNGSDNDGYHDGLSLILNYSGSILNNIYLTSCNAVVYKGISYTSSTVISDTVKSLQGCDSIYNVATITITPIIPAISSVDLNSCDSVIYKNSVFKSSTLFIDTVKTTGGCDSAYITVNIAINSISIAGDLWYPNHKVIPNTLVKLSSTVNQSSLISGSYTFGCLSSNANNTIKATKNNDVNKANGVTAVDIALTQSHILAKNLFNSPYKIIAADVSGDGKVTALDIVFMKRLILGIDTTFTNTANKQSRLWTFVDSSFAFTDNSNPFPFRDSISYTGLSASKTNQSFIGCKLGDVNWDWNPAIAKPQVNNLTPVELIYEYPSVRPDRASDGYIHLPVKVKNFRDMSGIQFTISFNPSLMQWQGMGNNPLGIETGTNHAAEGSVSFLWVDPKNEIKTLEDGSVLMELVFKTIDNGSNSIDNGQLIIDNLNMGCIMW